MHSQVDYTVDGPKYRQALVDKLQLVKKLKVHMFRFRYTLSSIIFIVVGCMAAWYMSKSQSSSGPVHCTCH